MGAVADNIWVGFDPREQVAFDVCCDSIKRNLTRDIPVRGLVLDKLRAGGLYTRPTETKGKRPWQLWDVISDAPMATEFSISRFLIGYLSCIGYAAFLDCDILVRGDLAELFDYCRQDKSKAVWCVKHMHDPKNVMKMDGQAQTRYKRKNWSSVMVWNVDHPSNRTLTVEMINSIPGRDLHSFSWLVDDEIGELGREWNWLVGHSLPVPDPKVIHFTSGGPWMNGYEHVPYADDWRAAREMVR